MNQLTGSPSLDRTVTPVRRADPRKDLAAIVRIAALFHDLGKATVMFQAKLSRALGGAGPEADPVRHEVHSAAVWDILFGETHDGTLPGDLGRLTPEMIDDACERAIRVLRKLPGAPESPFPFAFLQREGSLSYAIGMLVLAHHRLPEGDADHLTCLAAGQVGDADGFKPRKDLAIAPGTPFWHEAWWSEALAAEAASLDRVSVVDGVDLALRAALMFADHVGSAEKVSGGPVDGHLANTARPSDDKARPAPADDLATHTRRVYENAARSVELLHDERDSFPALQPDDIPDAVRDPVGTSDPRFRWQSDAAAAARSLCAASEGGFFACLMAGTGTGKTRGAPTILANAVAGDARPDRRRFRMSLGLGLRTLATQSGRDYVDDLGFDARDVSVLVGEAPLEFPDLAETLDASGSESAVEIPDWLDVDHPAGSDRAGGDSSLPDFCETILSHAGKNAEAGRRLLSPPVMVGTIDHLMGVAAPLSSRYLVQTLRVVTSDLVIDEIDQFDGEDIAAIGRLVYQAAAAGRRVIVMSATLAPDIAAALHESYCAGWSVHARAQGVRNHVNLLCAGDAAGSCATNAGGETLDEVMSACRCVIRDSLTKAPAARRGEILPACETWDELVGQVDAGCSRLHAATAVEIDGLRVSVGVVRMTRISHTAALAAQLPSGAKEGRFRALVCLHSQFPRLHRGWIEARLKRALTRKGDDPEAGVRNLLSETGLVTRAEEAGARDVEIVVVTSPVIETGNDLDFDYAILDPSSTRSIIQAAGRVRRHRPATGDGPNVLILGRSPIAMQQGRLAMPGVETRQPAETRVATPRLETCEGRHFADLAGEETFEAITAAPVLFEDGRCPLRDAEAQLRREMIRADADTAGAPLGRYIRRPAARLNRTITRTRRFRRSETGSLLYRMVGDDPATADWHLDLAPGTRQSALRPAADQGLRTGQVAGEHLFTDLVGEAWKAHAGDAGGDPGAVMRAEIPQYEEELAPWMTYTEFTGFTRGGPESLEAPFGTSEDR